MAGYGALYEQYNTPKTGMLSAARLVVEQLRLTAIDMLNFDHSIPIYLSKYNRYFYVNKISNFVPDKLTEVELVALQQRTPYDPSRDWIALPNPKPWL